MGPAGAALCARSGELLITDPSRLSSSLRTGLAAAAARLILALFSGRFPITRSPSKVFYDDEHDLFFICA